MNPLETDDWQNAYTENQGFADSLKRTGALLIPVLVTLIIPMFYTIFYVFNLINAMPINKMKSTAQAVIYISPGAALALLALAFSFLTLNLMLKNAGAFLKDFYSLPDSINVKELTGLRVFGRMPTPPPLSKLIKFPILKIKNGKIEPAENWQSIIGGPGKLQVEPGNAVYLERGNQFSRVLGQGPAFIDLHERIKVIVNLGPQSIFFDVNAWTKDGICIDLKAKGEYFLGSPKRNLQNENMLIPFDAKAVQQAVEAALKSGKEGHEWIKSAIGKTKSALSSYIAKKELEEIFMNDEQLFTKTTMDTLLKEINENLKNSGAYLSYFQIIDVEMREEITTQRLEAWESIYKRDRILAKGENKAHQIREHERVQAEIQRDLIYTLANGLERIDAADTEKMLQTVYNMLDRDARNSWWRSTSSMENRDSSQNMEDFDPQAPDEEE